MICPQCHEDQADKELQDFKIWVVCYACGYRIPIKLYKQALNNNDK